jgi:excinuclease ABC subunit C
MTDKLERKLDNLPDAPGVYLWKDQQGKVIYVGQAKRLRPRTKSYFAPGDHSPKNQLLREHIADIDTIVVESEAQSLLLENNLIKEYQPRFNVRLKDDKSYPSIAVTLAEPFPQVLVTRRRGIPGARYFGPFTDVGTLRRTLGLIRRLFQVRSCTDDLPRQPRERPCLDYYIGKCQAPCVGWQNQAAYRAMIDEVIDFLKGRTTDVRSHVRRLMAKASENLDYERAAKLRDTLVWLEQVETPAAVETIGSGAADVIGYARDGNDAVCVLLRVRDGKVLSRDHRFLENVADTDDANVLRAFMTRYYLPEDDRARRVILPFLPAEHTALEDLMNPSRLLVPQRGPAARLMDLADQNARHLMESLRLESFETEERAEDPVYALGRDLGLTVVPRSLVCIDISTNQGRDTVGSLVWFEAGRPRKSEYRKFKIKGEYQQDDYAAIHEVVTRYLTRRRDEEKAMPDLMIIDGGKGQLNAAWQALKELDLATMPLASLAKREEEVFLPGRSDPLVLSRRSSSLRLLQRARDEAHRFGLAYSRKRRSARTITSALLDLPGIGPTKRQRLLQHFGSLAGVKSATVAEIAELPGFSKRSAQRLLEELAEK